MDALDGAVKLRARGPRVAGAALGSGRVDVRLADERLRADVRLKGGLAESISVKARVPLRFGPDGVTLPPRDRSVEVAIEDLRLARVGELIDQPTLAGTVDLDATLRERASLTVDARSLKVAKIAIGDVHLEAEQGATHVHLQGSLKDGLARSLTLDVRAPVQGDPWSGTARWVADGRHRVKIEVERLNLRRLKPVAPMLTTGFVDFELQARGTARALRADLTFTTAGVAIDRRPIGALGGTVGYRRGRVDTHLRWVMGGGVTDLKARVPLSVDLAAGQVRWRQNEPHQVSLAARGVTEATLLPFARVPVGLDLNAEVEIEGTVDAPEGALTVQGTVHHATAGVVPVKLEAEVQPDEQSLGLRADLRGSSVEIAVDLEAPIARIRRGDAKIEDVPFEAHVEIGALDLALFTNALPVSLYGREGKLTASLDGQGTLGEPDLEGRIGVDDGALSVVDLNQRLERIQLEVALGADEVKIERLTARSGAGKLEANGAVRLDAGGPQGEVTMRLQDFPVVRPGMPRGLLDVRVRTIVESSHDEQRIEIGLHRPDVRLVGSNVPAAEPIASTDIVRFAHGEEDEEDDASDAGAAPSTRRVLVVRLADPLDISGRGVVMRWAGKVIIVQDDETSVSGGFEARDGDVDVLGRRFVIERGRVTMPAGGDEPYASLAASTEVGSYRITATLDGPVSKPNLELSSSPPLPDYEVLSVLINGAPDSADGDQSVEREAAALLAAFQSPALEQALNDRLGIDRVGLTFGEAVDQPILTLGKRVARDVYVETRYLHNTPEDENSTEAVVRYDFLPRWSVETSYGDAGEGEIELSWRRSFGDRGQLSDPTAAPRAEGEAPTDCACIDADGPCPCEEDDGEDVERAPEVASTDARRGTRDDEAAPGRR